MCTLCCVCVTTARTTLIHRANVPVKVNTWSRVTLTTQVINIANVHYLYCFSCVDCVIVTTIKYLIDVADILGLFWQ
jgi:hypothetical protein